jgi:hypothetical protein
MDCGCEQQSPKRYSILRGKKNFLELIRREVDEDQEDKIVSSGTFSPEEDETLTFEDEEKEVPLSDEDLIEQKRLEYILEKIEDLRTKNLQKIEINKKDE